MRQIARNLTGSEDGFLCSKRYLLMDRDSKCSGMFRGLIEEVGVNCVRLPPKSPNLNAYLERFMRSLKEECLNRMIFFGINSLRNAVQEYLSFSPAFAGEKRFDSVEQQDNIGW